MKYAGFWKRFAASLVDTFITAIIAGIAGFIEGITIASSNPYVDGGGAGFVGIFGNIVGLLVGWIYFAAFESSIRQGTLGKIALGIVVTDLKGKRISFAKASGRHFGKIISALLIGIGFLMVAFTEKKQGLHDMMSGCLIKNK